MESTSNTILIIEDDEGLAELLAEKMENSGYINVSKLSAHEAIDWLKDHTPLLMILDYSLPDMNGKELIVELKLKDIPIAPFIVSTGQGDERVAVDMMKLGARDYIIKDKNFLDLIPIVISKVSREIENEKKLKLAEQALIESNQFNKQIIQSAQEGIIVYDRDLNYQVWNPFMEKLTGIPASDIKGRHPLNLFPFIKNDDVIDILEKAIKGDNTKEVDIPYKIASSDKTGWVANRTSPLINAAGEIVGAITSVRDITERKNNEEKLKANEILLKELNADKDRFISILAHDLKSPFVLLLGLTELLSENFHNYDAERNESLINHISKITQNTYNLLEELLLWARAQSGKLPFNPQKIKFEDICADILNTLKLNAEAKNITISYSKLSKNSLYADPEMLKTTLRNLVSNAIKFTHAGGKIDINAEEKVSGITITIADNGVGIEPKILSNLFDISKVHTTEGTSNEKGTGLGLFICKEFIEKHGGKIWVESEVGRGSNFCFNIPFKEID